MQQTIALVDDDRNILTSVSMALEAEGFRTRTFSDGTDALKSLTVQPADLIILDIKMPRMDGMEVLSRLRAQSQVPVIFLTSKDDEVDEVLGLRMGADDYIKKPFSQRLLVERIRALLRREEMATATPKREGGNDVLTRGELRLDPVKHQCLWKSDDITLTVTEFLILKSLVQRPGHVKTRDQLMDAAYGELHLRRRSHHRLAHQAPAQEVQSRGRELQPDRDPLRGRLPLQGYRSRCLISPPGGPSLGAG